MRNSIFIRILSAMAACTAIAGGCNSLSGDEVVMCAGGIVTGPSLTVTKSRKKTYTLVDKATGKPVLKDVMIPRQSFHDSLGGRCLAAGEDGRYGVVGADGEWILPPEYDNVYLGREHALVSAGGIRRRIARDGTVMEGFLVDDVEILLARNESERDEGYDGYHETGYFAYSVDYRWGLMGPDGGRLTDPLYDDITAVSDHLFKARLDDDSGLFILIDDKGETIR